MNDDNNNFIGKGLLIAFCAFFIIWCFLFVHGFAYDLKLYGYDFNGFDSNADGIFTEFIKNDLDLNKYTERENFNVLKDKLIKAGYSESYINQFKIIDSPTPTPYVKSEEEIKEEVKKEIEEENNKREQLKSEIIEELNKTELDTDNGASDSIVSDENMEIRSISDSSGHNLDDIYDLLSDIYNGQYSLNESITDLNDSVSSIKNANDLENESPLEKPIENYNVKETVLLIIALVLVLGGIGFFIFKFTPTFRG